MAEQMTKMEAVLQEELKALQEQDVNIYVERFQEAMQTEQRLREIEEAMAKENQEVMLHQKILELEAMEAKAHPEPEDPRAQLSAGDDDFTTRMKEEGLRHKSSTGEEKRLTDKYGSGEEGEGGEKRKRRALDWHKKSPPLRAAVSPASHPCSPSPSRDLPPPLDLSAFM